MDVPHKAPAHVFEVHNTIRYLVLRKSEKTIGARRPESNADDLNPPSRFYQEMPAHLTRNQCERLLPCGTISVALREWIREIEHDFCTPIGQNSLSRWLRGRFVFKHPKAFYVSC